MSTARPSSTAISATSSAIIDFKDPARPQEVVGKLVDAGTMDRRRRNADLERHGPSLSPSDALRQPALRQLLARRLRDPRHRRHEQAEIRLRPRLEPAVPVADPHRAAGAVPAARPPRHAGRRRGRGAARPGRRRRSCGSSTSPTKRGRSRSPASRSPRRTARRSPTTPACTSSARRSAARRFRSPGSRTG